jgi:DNA-directed RNA polymerase subunit RPC12/RpoP
MLEMERRRFRHMQHLPVVLYVCASCGHAETNELVHGDDSCIVGMDDKCPQCGSDDWAPEPN